MVLEKLTEQQRDVLCRVHQRGLQQAAVTLSQLLRCPVQVELVAARMLAPATAGSGPQAGIGVRMGVSGDLTGGLLLYFAEPAAVWLSAQLLGGAASGDLLCEPAASTLREVGNIIASAFLASLDDQLQLASLPSPPLLARAPLADLLADCHPDAGASCLQVQTRIHGAENSALEGELYLLPDSASLDRLLALIPPA